MKGSNKISERDKQLLFILFAVLILYVTYQFGFSKIMAKTDSITAENTELSAKVSELERKSADKNNIIADTENKQKEIDDILSKFPGGQTQEKEIMFVTELEEYADMKVSSIAFTDLREFYSGNQPAAEAAPADGTVDETGEPADVADAASSETQKTLEESDNSSSLGNMMRGYQTSLTLSYQATYAGLKKSIDYVNQYAQRMNISNLTAAYDGTTGNLSGNITIDLYWLNGVERAYTPPVIDGISTGTDNIFGTFELPLEN